MTKTYANQKQSRWRRLPRFRLKVAVGSLAAIIGLSYAMGTFAAHAPVSVGIGASACGETVEMLGDARFDRIVTAWSSGFISGSNTTLAVESPPQRSVATVSEALILRHVRSYCAANPSETLASAIEALFAKLPEHY